MANFCTNCGNPVGENDGFCINCGQKILKIQGQTQPKTPAVNSSTQPAPKPPLQNGFSGAAQTAQPASRTAAQTGQTVSWKGPQVSGIVNNIRFPEGQREVILDLITGLDGTAGNSAAGAVSATANIRNPFLTLFSGARSLVFGFPNLLKNPKALIIAIALTILWTVLSIVNWRGNTNLFTDILSWPVFAKAGLGGGIMGIFGGIVGKGLIGAGFGSLFNGGAKRFGQGVKDIFRVKGMNLGSLLFGIGLSGLIYVFSAGYAGRGGSMAGICGLFLSLSAVTSKTGFIHSFAASLSARKGGNGAKSLVPQQYNSFLGGSAGGFALFVTLSGIFGIRETGPVWYLILLLFCIAGIVLMLITHNRKGAGKASAVLAALVLFLGHAAFFALPVRAAEDEETGYWEFVEQYDEKSEKLLLEGHGYTEELKGSASTGFYAVTTITLDEYRFSYTSLEDRHHDGTSCKGEYGDATFTFSPPPPARLNPGEIYTIEADVTGSCSAHIVGVGAGVMIDYLFDEESNYYVYFRNGDDGYVIAPTEIRQDEGNSGSIGAHVGPFHDTYSAEIPKGKYSKSHDRENLYIRFSFSSGGTVSGYAHINTYYHYRWVDPSAASVAETVTEQEKTEKEEPDEDPTRKSEKETETETETDYIIQTEETDAEINPGEDEGTPIIALIITGTIGTAAGTAAAGASSEDDDKKKKSYKMHIYKEFGDTIRPGEEVPVYARIVEVIGGTEYDRPGLTKDIVIRSHDEVFITEMYAALAGSYKCAEVRINPAQEVSNEGIIDFIYRGEGGVFINSVTFKAKMPEIIFYQDNMALIAKDERGGEVAFTVDGLIPEKTTVELRFIEGNSYETELVQAVEEGTERPIPGTWYACLADINEDEGEPGTYALHQLKVTATDGKYTAEGVFPVFRVTLGLYVGADTLNCYRILKESAAGKEAWDLEASDFDISYTRVPAFVVCVNEEEHCMYYKPAQPKFTITPFDPEDTIMQDRLDGIGIESRLIDIGDSIAEYAFFCTKGWLEPPLRLKARFLAEYFDTETGEKYTCDKTVMLLSQQYFDKLPISRLEFDDRVREWIFNARNIMEDVPGLMDQLCCEYVLLTDLYMGYDEHFGYDPILIAQLQKNFELGVFRARRLELKEEQELNLLRDKIIKNDDSVWRAASRSFAKVSDDYIDTWGGVAVRMALGFFTGGLSEIPFTAMDVNKAVDTYLEETPLENRTWGGIIYAGAKPVIIAAAMGSVLKAGGFVAGGIRANLPAGVRFRVGRFVVGTKRAVTRKLPLKLQSVLKSTERAKRLIKIGMKELAAEINSYDPRIRWRAQKEAAARLNAANNAAKAQAEKDALKMRNAPRTEKGKVIDTLQQAGELDGAKKADRFKKACDRWLSEHSDDAAKELREAYFEVQRNTFAQNALEFNGKTAGEIANKTKIASHYIRMYNECKLQYMDKPAAPLIRQKAAKLAGVREEDVIVYRATGKTAEDLNYSVMHDSDNSVLIRDGKTGMTSYLERQASNEAVYTSYCKVTGQSYTSVEDAMKKGAVNKVVNVTPDHPEAYREFNKIKTVNAFSERGMQANMETAKYKMVNDIAEMKQGVDRLMADKAKLQRVLRECEQFNLRKVSSLSDEALEMTGLTEKGYEGYHQIPKTYDWNASKDIYAQSMGMKKSGFSDRSRLMVERCRLVENQGPFKMTMGEMHDLLLMEGTTHEKAMSEMVLDFKTINDNVRTVNQSGNSWFTDPDPGNAFTGGLQGLSDGSNSRQED